MAQLPESAVTLPTVLKIYERYKKRRKEWTREHLGASQIGKECDRALWYQFRWASRPEFEGRMLRLFDTGDREEARLVADLRSVGVEVHQYQPGTRRQFKVSEVGGHFGGSMDGAGRGFQESSAWHVLEFKTSNAKKFAELKKKGVELAQPVHYAQMQVYMHLTGMERAYYLCVCKDTDEIYGERVRYHQPTAWRLINRARGIITADVPPPRISEDPDFFVCRFCDSRAICHEGAIPEVSCRTCLHSTPELDGDKRWSCARLGGDLTCAQQKRGCDLHLFIPQLVPWPAVDADPDKNSVTYENGIINGGDGLSSMEIKNAGL